MSNFTAGSLEVICMSLREIGAQICPLILLAQMPISTEKKRRLYRLAT